MTLCVFVCVCVLTEPHRTKRVNLASWISTKQYSGGKPQRLRTHGLLHTPGWVACAHQLTLGPQLSLISGAIWQSARAPWEATTSETSEPNGSQAHLPPKGSALPSQESSSQACWPLGAKNPSASSMSTHCQFTSADFWEGSRATGDNRSPGISQNLEHQLPRGSIPRKPGLQFCLGLVLFLHYITFSPTRGHNWWGHLVISSWRQLSTTRRSLFSGGLAMR